MAWTVNVGGIEVDAILPDRAVEFIKDQLRTIDDPAKGIWIHLGDQDAEGAIQVYITPGTPILFTRASNDPQELFYSFEQGTL